MTTELARRDIPTPTPQIDRSLSPQKLQEHRTAIAFEVRAVLSAYFQPHESDTIKAAQLAWWCDELQEWTREQVVWGLRNWNRDNPRLRPTPGDIVSILKAARGRKVAKRAAVEQSPEPPRDAERCSPEAAAEIMAKAGYGVKRMGDE